MAINPIASSSASADLGLGLQQDTQAAIEDARKKRLLAMQQQNKVGTMGQANPAWMSLTGNQY